MNKVTENEAITLFLQGKIGIFPTDTVFGIGCIVDNESAVKRLFSIKNRPENKPTPVLVNSIDMAQDLLQKKFSSKVLLLVKEYWPGGLTLVLDCNNEKIPSLVRGGTKTLGVRIPDSQMIKDIITKMNKPLLAPSANFSGEKTPFLKEDLDPNLISLVDFYLDGVCNGQKSSTVLDCTSEPFTILRQGAIVIDDALL